MLYSNNLFKNLLQSTMFNINLFIHLGNTFAMDYTDYIVLEKSDQEERNTAAKRRRFETYQSYSSPRMNWSLSNTLSSSSNVSSSEDLEVQSSDTETYTVSTAGSSGYPNTSGSESKSEDTERGNAINTFSPLQNGSVSLELEKGNLWNKFYRLGTEMIINRTGRRMFPYVEFTLKGLDPAGLYDIMFDIIPADTNYFKFMDNKWVAIGEAEQDFNNNFFKHPDSPQIGSKWMDKIISFQNVKLSNQPSCQCGIFTLRTLQKYLVRISLIKHKTDRFSVLEIPIPVSTFVAVTAYNNREVTELKIKSNPYSKAFRYPKSRMKKPSVSLSDKKINQHHNKRIPTSRMDVFTESFDDIHHIQLPPQSTALQHDRRRPSLSISEKSELKNDQGTQTELSMADGNLWCMLPVCPIVRNLLNMATSPSCPRNMNLDINSVRQYFETL
nr:T-box transcription factor TBX5-A [Crassostrea gigas]